MSLRLAWAGPWNGQSAIATFGVLVVEALAALGHQVEVLRTETGAELLLLPCPAPGRVAPVAEWPLAEVINGFDGIIVNLGDHYGFHGGAMPLLRETAPLVVLHDAIMDGFTHNWRQASGADAWRVGRLLGEGGGVAPFCALASGVVVHGPHYLHAAAAACAGPVTHIPLAYAAPPVPPPGLAGPGLVVATVGHVNRNKRADEVLRAIGASPRLRKRVSYMLIGPVRDNERARLLAVAEQAHAPAPHFTGWVPDEVLRILLAGTDVMCCLRHPALEGGSASLVTAMLSARPTLVSDHASYAEVPDGLVLKCAPGDEGAHVLHHLEAVLDNPDEARAMGQRARAYALDQFSPASYAARLLRALNAATSAQPAVMAARRVGQQLAGLGMASDNLALPRINGILSGMLGNTGNARHE